MFLPLTFLFFPLNTMAELVEVLRTTRSLWKHLCCLVFYTCGREGDRNTWGQSSPWHLVFNVFKLHLCGNCRYKKRPYKLIWFCESVIKVSTRSRYRWQWLRLEWKCRSFVEVAQFVPTLLGFWRTMLHVADVFQHNWTCNNSKSCRFCFLLQLI